LEQFYQKRKTPLRGYLVLYSYLDYRYHVARGKLIRASGSLTEKLQFVCRCAGCLGTVVVWSQCSSIFLNHSLFGFDVLLPAKGSESPGLLLPSFYHSLLGPYFPLHLGGPHHLLYTALPDWAQSLGTVFSVMLIAPSWGGMINGLLTLRGAWDKVRDDVVLKFL
jgi:hypothetical protein